MADEPKPRRNLSDISHLFLSSIRDRQTNGAPRPKRIPPKPAEPDTNLNVDMTPEEFAQAFGASDSGSQAISPVVSAIIGSHLNGKQFDQVKRYARHLAGSGRRVGLIEIDMSEVRVMVFDEESGQCEDAAAGSDLRTISDAITELSCDLHEWLVLIPNPRTPEARSMLRNIDRWTVLTTCDHDGVVSCYRTLKGLAELGHPHLSLAMLDAHSDDQAEQVFNKISSVCLQFLNWPVEARPLVADNHDIHEHLVVCWRPSREAGAPIGSAHWHLVADLLAKLQVGPEPAQQQTQEQPAPTPTIQHEAPAPPPVTPAPAPVQSQEAPRQNNTQPAPGWLAPEPIAAAPAKPQEAISEVIDLPDGPLDDGIVVNAMLRRFMNDLVECPLPLTACPQAKLVVGRDRQLMVLAAARQGLAELRAIGTAYRWVIENRALIAMALPQLAIDAHSLPHLRLMIDQADADAEVLRPILQSNTVTVQTYRRVRWGDRTGLLLEAA